MSTQPPLRLLIPRPRPQADGFAAEVEARMPGEWAVDIAPLMEIRATGATVDLTETDLVVFTSRNGVDAFAAATADRSLPAVCVGDRTTAAARKIGLQARCLGSTGRELAEALAKEPPCRILHVRGSHVAGNLSAVLQNAGHSLREAVLYDQVDCPLPPEILAALAAGEIDAVTLFSPRMAVRLGDETHDTGLAPATRLLCMSEAVARQARKYHAGLIIVCAAPDAEAMLTGLRAIAEI